MKIEFDHVGFVIASLIADAAKSRQNQQDHRR